MCILETDTYTQGYFWLRCKVIKLDMAKSIVLFIYIALQVNYVLFNLVLVLFVLLVLTPFSGSFFTLNLQKKTIFSFEKRLYQKRN